MCLCGVCLCVGVFVTQEDDMRGVDIVYLAAVSSRGGVNHAYLPVSAAMHHILYIIYIFAHYSVNLVPACAPIAWMPTPVQLIYLLITGRSFIKDYWNMFLSCSPVTFH